MQFLEIVMSEIQVSIGQVKRDISDLVNKVAYAGDRIILTSRGRPKAALVSMDDYERLKKMQLDARLKQWQEWEQESDALVAEMRQRRGRPINLEPAWEEFVADREARDEQILGY